jgi:hypothetical protein
MTFCGVTILTHPNFKLNVLPEVEVNVYEQAPVVVKVLGKSDRKQLQITNYNYNLQLHLQDIVLSYSRPRLM